MSADLDALADSARVRGLKLVRSRVRTPGKRRFGKVGLTDANGEAVFGMDAKGPTAKPDEVADYLRSAGANDWSASLGGAKIKRRPKPRAAPKPKPAPELAVRPARAGDAGTIVSLLALLEAKTDTAGVRKRMAALARAGTPALVAARGKHVVAVCGISVMVAIHRDAPVGRVHTLVVAEAERGQGIGKLLVDEAAKRLRSAGCELLEITSNDRLTEAHAFYRHLGFEQTSRRFARKL